MKSIVDLDENTRVCLTLDLGQINRELVQNRCSIFYTVRVGSGDIYQEYLILTQPVEDLSHPQYIDVLAMSAHTRVIEYGDGFLAGVASREQVPIRSKVKQGQEPIRKSANHIFQGSTQVLS